VATGQPVLLRADGIRYGGSATDSTMRRQDRACDEAGVAGLGTWFPDCGAEYGQPSRPPSCRAEAHGHVSGHVGGESLDTRSV